MKLKCTKNYDDMCMAAAVLIAAQVTSKPDSVLGLATGSTPIGVYEDLVKWYDQGILDFSKVHTVNLDEYKGLSKDHDQSYYYFMHDHLFRHINIPEEHINIPDGKAASDEAECERYEEVIASQQGIDLQLLGLGHDGHIGFNEPSDSFPEKVHVVDLTETTIQANKRFFKDTESVPAQAFTMGIGDIFKAKKVVLIVNGSGKAEIVKKVVMGEITPQVPASVLRLHPDATIIGDKEAFSLLPPEVYA